jgi:hypothetical protein
MSSFVALLVVLLQDPLLILLLRIIGRGELPFTISHSKTGQLEDYTATTLSLSSFRPITLPRPVQVQNIGNTIGSKHR